MSKLFANFGGSKHSGIISHALQTKIGPVVELNREVESYTEHEVVKGAYSIETKLWKLPPRTIGWPSDD